MGLAIGVGTLAELVPLDPEGAEWTRASLTSLASVLERNGLPAHEEPEIFPTPLFSLRHSCTSFPYSFLHYLRRAYAYVHEERPIRDEDALRPEDEGPPWRERLVWYALWEAATTSIEHRTVIQFH